MELLSMEPNDLNLKPRTPIKIAIQFLIGAVLGIIFIYTFFARFWVFTAGVDTVQIIISVLAILTCGTISAVWGEKGLNWLSTAFQSESI
jgi:predicted membrane channel-forming protein YqfA (hemolysin III family)